MVQTMHVRLISRKCPLDANRKDVDLAYRHHMVDAHYFSEEDGLKREITFR